MRCIREQRWIELDDLPATVRADYAAVLGPSIDRGDTLRAWGSRYARLVLDRCGGNKREASRVLGISYHTLNAYLRGAHIDGDGPLAAQAGASELTRTSDEAVPAGA